MPFESKKHAITSRATYKQLSHFYHLLRLLTQLQLDTKGKIMDIFLLLPSCVWCVNHFHCYYFPDFLSFYFHSFQFSIFLFLSSSFSFFGVSVIFPLVISRLSIIGYTLG